MRKNTKKATLFITQGAVIAALYVALTWCLYEFSYGLYFIEFRLSEVLTVLPFFTSAAIPGLVIGCFIANIVSPMGIYDMAFGTLATLLSSVCTWYIGRLVHKGWKYMAPLPPVVFNTFIIGAMLAILYPGDTGGTFWSLYLINGAGIFIGEIIICFGLGIPLIFLLKKHERVIFKNELHHKNI